MIEPSLDQLQQYGQLGIGGETISRSAALVELYRRNGFEPLWLDQGNAAGLVEAIHDAEAQGLDPREYHLDAISGRRRDGVDPAVEAAGRDLLMTDAFIRIAGDVRYGAASPDRPDPDILPVSLEGGDDPVTALQQVIYSGNVRDYVARLEPRNPTYERLKRALATYREIQAAGGWRTIAPGAAPQPGERSARVTALKERLAMSGDLPRSMLSVPHASAAAPRSTTGAQRSSAGSPHSASAGAPRAAIQPVSDVYDNSVREAVRAFQTRHGIAADGALGAQTIAALNVPVEARIGQIRATLERSRWVLHDLPQRYVMVNVAAFSVFFIDNDEVVWRSRVIVGDRDKETPMFRADMQYIVLNPTWSVPPSIVKKELMPGLARDPRYLSRRHIVRVGEEYVQAAGKGNALGRIKLMLPNPYSVYLHDTPTKSLFDRKTRTFSHGCVRVEHPVELAALALDDPAWSVASLDRAIARGQTRTVTLRNPLPVLVAYWSVNVARDGTVEFLPDVYGRDEETLRALGHERRVPRQKTEASV